MWGVGPQCREKDQSLNVCADSQFVALSIYKLDPLCGNIILLCLRVFFIYITVIMVIVLGLPISGSLSFHVIVFFGGGVGLGVWSRPARGQGPG